MKQVWRCETNVSEMVDHLTAVGRAIFLLWEHYGNVDGEAKTATRATIQQLRQTYWLLASMRDPEDLVVDVPARVPAEPALVTSPIRRYEDDERFVDP